MELQVQLWGAGQEPEPQAGGRTKVPGARGDTQELMAPDLPALTYTVRV